MRRIEYHACFQGRQEVWEHDAQALGCTMHFGIFLPERALAGNRCSTLYWLSGLTCTEQNFITKAGAQAHAAHHGVIVVAADVSPRGVHVPDDEAYDLGQGASFYVNATQSPWSGHYRMHDYIAVELPNLVESHFAASEHRCIAGHSMGGHGALVTALRRPGRYQSISAFSPIVAPSQVPWGQKALTAYLGENREVWKQWDCVELIAHATERLPLLVDQGLSDEFLNNQLKPFLLKTACEAVEYPLQLRMQEGYDHSYYFISTFLADHFRHHFT
jgi:S-formylglutathione hydrolase